LEEATFEKRAKNISEKESINIKIVEKIKFRKFFDKNVK
jgi:hypothetical protein